MHRWVYTKYRATFFSSFFLKYIMNTIFLKKKKNIRNTRSSLIQQFCWVENFLKIHMICHCRCHVSFHLNIQTGITFPVYDLSYQGRAKETKQKCRSIISFLWLHKSASSINRWIFFFFIPVKGEWLFFPVVPISPPKSIQATLQCIFSLKWTVSFLLSLSSTQPLKSTMHHFRLLL